MTPELEAAGQSARTARRRWNEVLVSCSLYVASRADTDPTAANLNAEVEAAFDALLLENLAAAQVVAEAQGMQPDA